MKKLQLDQLDATIDSFKQVNGIGELFSCIDAEKNMSTETLKHIGYVVYEKSGKILEDMI